MVSVGKALENRVNAVNARVRSDRREKVIKKVVYLGIIGLIGLGVFGYIVRDRNYKAETGGTLTCYIDGEGYSIK